MPLATTVRRPSCFGSSTSYPHGRRRSVTTWSTTDWNQVSHDLRDYLRRKDGSSKRGPPSDHGDGSVPVLPPGQMEPNALELERRPDLGVIGCSSSWGPLACGCRAGVCSCSSAGGGGPRPEPSAARPKTLAERLRPLVEEAVAGTLDPGPNTRNWSGCSWVTGVAGSAWRDARRPPPSWPCWRPRGGGAQSTSASKDGSTSPGGAREPVDIASLARALPRPPRGRGDRRARDRERRLAERGGQPAC